MSEKLSNKNVPPGTPVGPMQLPASYTNFQCVQLGFKEGRKRSASQTWEMKVGENEWKVIDAPSKVPNLTIPRARTFH